MPRTAEDLKALIIAGDQYRETVKIEYLGQEFEVPIRPLTDEELTEVLRALKGMSIIRKIQKTAGKSSAEDQEIADQLLEDDGLGEAVSSTFKLYKLFCEKGIVDQDLARLVSSFRYGLTAAIGQRIQTISQVPPEVIANFFDRQKAN